MKLFTMAQETKHYWNHKFDMGKKSAGFPSGNIPPILLRTAFLEKRLWPSPLEISAYQSYEYFKI